MLLLEAYVMHGIASQAQTAIVSSSSRHDDITVHFSLIPVSLKKNNSSHILVSGREVMNLNYHRRL